MNAKELKRAKFVELAEKRVTRTIKDIRLIGNLSNRGNYEYSDEDILKIYRTLSDELKTMKARFQRRGKKGGADFTLD